MTDFRPFPEIGLEARRESPKEITLRLLKEAQTRYAYKCYQLLAKGRFGDGKRFVRRNQFGQPVIVKL